MTGGRTIDDMLSDEAEGMWDGTPEEVGPARTVGELKAKLTFAPKGSNELDQEVASVLGVALWRFTTVITSAMLLKPESWGYEIKQLRADEPVTVILVEPRTHTVFSARHHDMSVAMCLACLDVIDAMRAAEQGAG